jgi:hypothetical protein
MPRHRALIVAASIFVAAGVAACDSGVVGVRPTVLAGIGAQLLAGTWAHSPAPPSYRETMTLTQRGDSVSGSGTFATEAGLSGTTSITGTFARDSLTLFIVRDIGVTEVFAGAFKDPTHLQGTLSIDGQASTSFDYTKQ